MAGELVSIGTMNNAIAHSVNRAASFMLNLPVHRCEFEVTMSMPAFSVPQHITSFSGDSSTDWGGPLSFAGISFDELGMVEDDFIDADSQTVSGYMFYVYYELAVQTVGGVHSWMLQRTAAWPPTLSQAEAFIHTAWVAPWRTAFSSAPSGGNQGTLTFQPMAESDYKAWWIAGNIRYNAAFADLPEVPGTGNRADYHFWVGASDAITSTVTIAAQR